MRLKDYILSVPKEELDDFIEKAGKSMPAGYREYLDMVRGGFDVFIEEEPDDTKASVCIDVNAIALAGGGSDIDVQFRYEGQPASDGPLEFDGREYPFMEVYLSSDNSLLSEQVNPTHILAVILFSITNNIIKQDNEELEQ